MDTDAHTRNESEQTRLQTLTKQRDAFLREVYERSAADPSKTLPYSAIAEALGFDSDLLEKTSRYLEGEKLIKIIPIRHMEVKQEGPESLQIVFLDSKGIVITHKGIVRAEKSIQSTRKAGKKSPSTQINISGGTIQGNIVGNVSGENAAVNYTSNAVAAREVPAPTPTPISTLSSKSAGIPRIFLCHANEDKPQVRDVYHCLKAEGFEPWLDEEDILPGQLWDQEIRKALKNSDFILIFFSQNSVAKRGYVQREMKLALEVWEEIPEGQIHTIPVRLDTCELPDRFRKFQRVDLYDERGFERMVRAIRLGLEQRQQDKPPHSTASRESVDLTGKCWDTVQNSQLRQLLVQSEHALESGDLIISMAGTKFAFDEIVSAICGEYDGVAGSKNPSSFQSFLFATERLGLSRADARKCREITSSFDLGIAEAGNWRLVPLSTKTDEDYRGETAFVLRFLAKLIPPAQNAYPDAMQGILYRTLCLSHFETSV